MSFPIVIRLDVHSTAEDKEDAIKQAKGIFEDLCVDGLTVQIFMPIDADGVDKVERLRRNDEQL